VLIVFEVLERMSEGGPRVLNMKKHKNIPTSMNPRSISQARRAAQAKRAPLVDAATVANEVLFAHSDTVDALNAIMRHPCSLNRMQLSLAVRSTGVFTHERVRRTPEAGLSHSPSHH